MSEQLENIKQIIVPILQANGVEYAGVFGSVARGEGSPDSDVDLMVRFNDQKKLSLLGFIGVEQKLSAALGKKVDLVEEGHVHPYVEPYVLKDLTNIYGERSTNIHRPYFGRYRHYPRVRHGLGV